MPILSGGSSSKADSPIPLTVASGLIRQAGEGDSVSELDMMVGVATRDEVERMLQLLNEPSLQKDLDVDPDTVDGFATQEFFLDNDSLREGRAGKPEIESPEQFARRQLLCQKLS